MATIKDWARMCEAKGTDCICCELAMQRCGMSNTLSRAGDIDRIDKAVDKWAKDHPAITYLTEFKKHFPGIRYDDAMIIKALCVANLYSIKCPEIACKDCWNTHIEG